MSLLLMWWTAPALGDESKSALSVAFVSGALTGSIFSFFLGVRELACGRIPGQPKRPQPFSPLPQGPTLGFIVCPRLRAFPSSLLLLVFCFVRHCKGSLLFGEFNPRPFI